MLLIIDRMQMYEAQEYILINCLFFNYLNEYILECDVHSDYLIFRILRLDPVRMSSTIRFFEVRHD